VLTAVVAALLAASLVRFSPGAAAGEEQLDLRRSAESQGRLAAQRQTGLNLAEYYRRFLTGWVRGDFGDSRSLARPVAELLRERIEPTAKILSIGLAIAWVAGLTGAVVSNNGSVAAAGSLAAFLGLVLQSVPAAALALFVAAWGGRGPALCGAALSLVLYPRVLQYSRNLLRRAYDNPHVTVARARGIGSAGVLCRHVLPVAAPQLLSFAAVSVSLAISAAIPLEVILDVPGVGQLAWQAALARDLNLLVNVTALLSVAVVAAATISEGVQKRVAA
jgi:peptide/nickel transport system permease protein